MAKAVDLILRLGNDLKNRTCDQSEEHTVLQDWQIKQKLTKFTALCECAQCTAEFRTHFYAARKSQTGHLCKTCKSRISTLKEFSPADLLEVFEYIEETGELLHKLDSLSGMRGDPAGYAHSEGYRSISIGGKEYLLHRVIWFMKTGRWPYQIDHIDHDRSNNRWRNMREVFDTDNQKNTSLSSNNRSGVNGVRVLPSGRFYAYIMVNRKQISLGTRDTLEEAATLRKAADLQYGFHGNHGG